MKEGGCLLVIFLLVCIESCSSLDYENICSHHFTQGCPVHGGDSWRCAKVLTNCSGDQFSRYHCVLNSTGQPFEVKHICAPLSQCVKGTIPIYDQKKEVISCKPCRNDYYQPYDTRSDETPECLQKHKCEQEGHKIGCDMDTGLSNTEDVHCRCDARNNYILTNFEIRGKCVEWAHASCYFHPCPHGQERLLNYSCASLCPQGQKRDDNDICILISLVNQTTASFNDNMTMSVTGESKPKTTVMATTTLPSTSEQSTRDSNIETIIASVIAVALIATVVILVLVCWKCKVYKTVRCRMRPRGIRRQLPEDAIEEEEQEEIIRDSNLNGTAQRDTCQGMTNVANPNGTTQRDTCQEEMTKKGSPSVVHIHHHHKKVVYNVNTANAQFGNKSQITSYIASAEEPKTPDDSSSRSSRRGSDLQLADSLHLHNSGQGELPVDRNSSEDIESDTQPKQTSNGTDSSERHASSEETYRKVVE